MTEPAAAPTISTAQPEDYFQLLKPRVMSLVIFTAVTGLVVARSDIGWLSAAIAVLCIAGGDGRVSRNDALTFGVILSVFSVMLLGMATNWLAGGLLALTIVYYAAFYTLLLKRRTPQNIVIGGAAGAFPPVIGWAAATGTAPWQAWLLFLIIFLWTPPHSWALALYSAGDYAKAGIPMMPVARGAKSTRLQILLYSLVFVPVAVAPGLTGLGGRIYLAVSVAGGLGFLYLAARLWRSRAGDQPDKAEAVGREAALYDVRIEAKPARNLFAFSILYLMALFAALLVESMTPLMSL